MSDEKSWRTDTVVALCRSMRESQDYSACPVLADALQDADYPDEGRLVLMRSDGLDPIEAERLVAVVYSDETAAAVRWIARYAAEELGPASYPGRDEEEGGGLQDMTYVNLMRAALAFAETGYDGLGAGCMRWSNATCYPKYEKFWPAWSLVTGRPPPDDDGGFLACSC